MGEYRKILKAIGEISNKEDIYKVWEMIYIKSKSLNYRKAIALRELLEYKSQHLYGVSLSEIVCNVAFK